MVRLCNVCGQRIPQNEMYTYSVNLGRSEGEGLFRKAEMCKECCDLVQSAFEGFFKRLDELEMLEKQMHSMGLRRWLEDQKREEQELDAWKADIYGGDKW